MLRRWRESDIEEWLAHLNTPQVRVHLGSVDSAEKVAEKFTKVERAWAENGFSFLAVERREDGEFLGACGISRIDSECAPPEMRGAIEIGWQLRADRWGQGYATEAAAAVLALAFDGFGFPIVFAQTSERNAASWRVMQRLGMARLADLEYDDPGYPPEENPTKVYAMTREEWQGERAGGAR